MSNVIHFPTISNADCQASSMPQLTPADLRARAWSNYYRAERQSGACPDLAYQRADAFVRDLDRLEKQNA